jgi:kojibiose phosphorylase
MERAENAPEPSKPNHGSAGSHPSLEAVIFDLDGILTDTSAYHARAWQNLVRELGHEPPPDLEERVKGVSRMESLLIALGGNAGDYDEEQLRDLATRKNDEYKKAVEQITEADLFDGVLDLFEDLKANGIKIVLGSASKNARPVLERLGIAGFFDAVADGYSFENGKPAPDVFLAGARMAGVGPEDAIVLEDAEAGIEAALAGGFVAIGMGNPRSLRKADVLIESLTELSAERLRRIHAECRTGGSR